MKCIRCILVATLLALIFPFSLLAHETKTVGPMSVLLHMEPQDSPVVKSPAMLYFEITDAEDNFQNSLCKCTVTIYEKDTKIFEELLTKEEPNFGHNTLSTEFEFPKRAVYKVIFDADPKKIDTFKPFSTQYFVRVERTDLSQNPVDPVARSILNPIILIYVVGFFVAFGILLVGFNIIKIKK